MNPEPTLITEEDIVEKAILLNLNQTYRIGMSESEVLEVACRAWKGDEDRMKQADYAIAVYQGEIKGVFAISTWEKDIIEPGRLAFKGKIEPSSIHDNYMGKRITAWKSGQKTPIIYVNL
jgi:hypothetical protein